ncbi:hypothetical protein V8C42DRAFT_346802 [Trichoderma barbatum]
MDYLTIISELVDTRRSSRVTRIVVQDKEPVNTGQQQTKTQLRAILHGLDPLDEGYLNNKSAFSLPSKHCCEAMLQAYFSLGHPHAPILDPVEFVKSYLSGSFSLFLMQALLSNAALYAPMSLIEACGFKARCEAIETYFSRADLLYQFGYERNQLRSLQGSVVLGMTAVTGSFDRDFRYWLHNAIRDITLLLGGAANMRMIHSEDNEVLTLPTPESLGDDIPARYAHLIPPLSQQQRQYFIKYCRPARIATRCLSILKSQPHEAFDYTQSELSLWRCSLPEILQISHGQPSIRSDSIWRMVLMTSSYRYESMLYRMLKKNSEGHGDMELQQRAAQGVRAAVYELDVFIGRAMAYDMLQMLPMALYAFFPPTPFHQHCLNRPSTAPRLVLSPSESDAVKSRSRIYIHQAIVFLQQCRDLPFMRIALELVDWALTKQNLLSTDRLNASATNSNANHSTQQDLPRERDVEAIGPILRNQQVANVSVLDVIERLDEFLELGAIDDTLISDLWQM